MWRSLRATRKAVSQNQQIAQVLPASSSVLTPREKVDKNIAKLSANNELVQFRSVHINTLRGVFRAAIILTVYIAVSAAVLRAFMPEWTIIDAAYFAMATMSTVGYGDLAPPPGNVGARVFVILMIVIGVLFVFSSVAGVVSMCTTPITKAGRQFLGRLFPEIPLDLEGDGEADIFMPRHWAVYYGKNLLPSLILNIVAQLAFAGFFVAIDDSWTYFDAIYHCIATATTVGYGDVNNSTQAGRVLSCVHIVVSVAMLGELIVTMDELRLSRTRTQARINMLTKRLDSDNLDNLLQHARAMRPDVTRDVPGLTELEFVLVMMLELKVVDLNQVQPFIKQFRLLDVDNNALLGRDDLEVGKNKSLAELQLMGANRAKLERTISVNDRTTPRGESMTSIAAAAAASGKAIAPSPEISDIP